MKECSVLTEKIAIHILTVKYTWLISLSSSLLLSKTALGETGFQTVKMRIQSAPIVKDTTIRFR